MTWLAGLRASALVGAGRHPVPAPPPELNLHNPDGLSPEELLLDQAALADVATRAARTAAAVEGIGPIVGTAPPAAPPDDAPAAPGEAARLLELLLTQPPVAAGLRNRLVTDWLEYAAKCGRRVPHRLLPALFTLADSQPVVKDRLEPAIGTRGRWLLEVQRAGMPGAFASEPSVVTGVGTEATGDDAADTLKQLRRTDPAAAVERLEADWDGLSARGRAALLALLETNLHAGDEPLLERALDDKAKTVREVAAGLLDLLPDSARAARMAARLRPLLGVKGVMRKRLEVDLPPAPDGAALRDGIPAAPRSGEPDRLRRLDAIIRGAPLEVWTTTAGRDPAGTLALLDGEPRVVEVLRVTAVLRGDREWARALLGLRADGRLLSCLPPGEREQWLVRHLRAGTVQPVALVPLLQDLPTPWGHELAAAVLDMVARKDGGYVAAMLASVLPMGLPAEAAVECRRLLARSDEDASRRRVLRDVVQYHSFRQSLMEAFS